ATRQPTDSTSDRRRLERLTQPFVTPADLRVHIEERLPEYMVPATISIVERLPLSAHGKVDRRALATQAWTPAQDDSAQTPLSDHEAAVARHWTDVLQIERAAANDHFFRVGGHSLSAVRLAGRVSEAFGVDVPVAAVFDHPTLRELAAHIEKLSAAAPVPAI